ncbi:MAG TPA: phosphotransferase [Gaiella sp.]|nr:phosphotransferase [Gaiella sp.]
MTGTDIWTDPDWLAEARQWIVARLGERGATITGEITQPHAQWWSTALEVPTSEGTVFFKASQPSGAFEGALTHLVAREYPARTAELLAFDPGRAWMLTRDAGTRLREAAPGREQLEHWERLLPQYAELQIAFAPRSEELIELGVTDLRLEALPPLLERASAETELLTRDDEDGMTPNQQRALVEGLAPFAELCARLAEIPIPPSLQHDDLHDGNVFVRDGEYVLFDWGDACVTHPFHTLVVTLRATAYRLGLASGDPAIVRLCDAYLEPWTRVLPRPDLAAALELARRTGTVQRALAWYLTSPEMPPAVRAEHGASVPYGLRLYLADAPFGAWEP